MITAAATPGPPSGSPASARGWPQVTVPLTILVFAAAVRLAGLDKSLWIDEAGSYMQATARDFLASARAYDHPPLYFALLRIGLRCTTSFTLLRLFSVGCGLASVALFCFWPDHPTRGGRWLAGLLLAASPAFVSNSQELRHYALLSAALAAALACAWRLARSPGDPVALLGLAGTLGVAAATHLLTAIFMIALAAWLLWSLRRTPFRLVVRVAAAFAPAGLLLVFFKSFFLLRTVKTPGDWWMPPLSPQLLGVVFREDTGWSAFSWLADACERHLHGSGQFFLVAAAVGTVFVGWAAWGHRWAGPARSLLAMAAVYWAIVIAYSLVVAPIVWPRTMLPGMLPCLLAVGLGVSAQPRPRCRAGASVVAALLALAMMVPWLRGLAWQPSEDLRGLAAAVRTQSSAADLLLLVNGVECGLEPYWPEYKQNAELKIELRAPRRATLGAVAASLAHSQSRTVLLIYREDLMFAPNRAVLDEIKRVLARGSAPPEEIWNRTAYHVLRFSPLAPP